MRPFSTLLLLAGMLMTLASCASDSEPEYKAGSDSVSYLKSISQGKITAVYQMDGYACHERTAEAGGEWSGWKEVDPMDYDGLQMPIPARIVFHKGKMLTPLSLFNISTGPHPLYMPFMAYCNATGFSSDLYVSHAMTLDEETSTLSVEGSDCRVESASKNGLRLSVAESFTTWRGNAGEFRWTLSYEEGFYADGFNGKYVYSSKFDAYMGIIGMLRDRFGSGFDMNPYLTQDGIQLDNSYVDIDALEAAVRSYGE